MYHLVDLGKRLFDARGRLSRTLGQRRRGIGPYGFLGAIEALARRPTCFHELVGATETEHR